MDWVTEGDGGIGEVWGPSLQGTIDPVLATVVVWGLLAASFLVLVTLLVTVRRRRLMCPEREVSADVDLEECGFPGFRHATAVVACSVFEPRTSVRCRSACLARQAEDVRARRASRAEPRDPAVPLPS
jgi:hypothetical protein